MAIVKLILRDTNLETGAYACDYSVTDSQTDDGKVTAAHFTGKYLSLQVPQAAFREGCENFGDKLIEALEESGALVHGSEPQTLTLTLTDADIHTGRYTAQVDGTDRQKDNAMAYRPTAAQIAGYYMRALLNDSQFVMQVWAFAEEVIANNKDASIGNTGHAPGVIYDPSSQAAQIAA